MTTRNTRIYERGQIFSLWLRDHVAEHSDTVHREIERTLVLESLELVGSLLMAAVFPADAKDHLAEGLRSLTRLRGQLGRATRVGSIDAETALRAYGEIAALDRMLHGRRVTALDPTRRFATNG